MTALGLTLPFDDVSLADHRPLLSRLVAGGFDDIWTGEVAGPDGLTPLALFKGWEPDLAISWGVASVFTRGPAILAMSAAALADASPGRCRFGVGAGSPVVAQTWNGAVFERPYQRTADTLAFLRQVLSGEKADDYETVHGAGFKLARLPEVSPRLMLGVAGPRMQELAAAEADTMMLNFLSASDVHTIRRRAELVSRRAPGRLETAARVFLLPSADDAAEAAARRFLAGYLTVPTYARFQEWLGRADELAEMNDRWGAGDRRGAVAAIPEATVRDLVIFGDPAQCAASVAKYFDAGLDAVTLAVLPDPAAASPDDRVRFLLDVQQEWTALSDQGAVL